MGFQVSNVYVICGFAAIGQFYGVAARKGYSSDRRMSSQAVVSSVSTFHPWRVFLERTRTRTTLATPLVTVKVESLVPCPRGRC